MEKEKEKQKGNQFQSDVPELMPFDPIVLILDVLRRWYLVVMIAIVCGVGTYILTDFTYTPVYQTNTTLVVTTRGSSSSVYDNLDSTTKLAGVFTEVLNSSLMRKNILEELGMDSFDGTITASAVPSTNLLTLTVKSGDPRTAFLVTQALLDHHEELTYQVIGDIVVEVLQYPTVPAAPVNTANSGYMMQRVMLLAAVGTLLLMAFLSYNRDAVRSHKEAEKKLDCWCLGEIHHETKRKTMKDVFTRRKKGILVTNPDTGFQYVTTISKLRRRVEQHMHGGKILMITSVMENEGKSTVAVNLAIAMAKKKRKVLLIDCDLHKPACRKILEHNTPAHFIQDVIKGTAKLEDAVSIDKLSDLHVLFAKKSAPQTAGDLVNSDGLVQLLDRARELYDFIVIDLPPMSVATDPECVMEYADASMLVVRQNGATAPVLNHAISVLHKGKAQLLGCVLNNVYSTILSNGEGYGTGYGWYGGYDKTGKYGKYGKYHKYSRYARYTKYVHDPEQK